MTMQQLIDSLFAYADGDGVGSLLDVIFGWVAEIASTIVSTPLLLFTTGFLFIGGCIGIFGRLLSRN